MFEPKTVYDFRIYSDDKKSHVTFILEQYLHHHYPSLSCGIDVLNNNFSGSNVDIWFSMDKLIGFIEEIEKGNIERKCSLHSMSPDEFDMSIERINRKGDFIITYSLSKSNYFVNRHVKDITLSGGFQFNQEYLISLIQDLKRFSSVATLQTDIDFRLTD